MTDHVPSGVKDVEQLIAKWLREQATYPHSPEGEHAAAAVRCCANELAALRPLIAAYKQDSELLDRLEADYGTIRAGAQQRAAVNQRVTREVEILRRALRHVRLSAAAARTFGHSGTPSLESQIAKKNDRLDHILRCCADAGEAGSILRDTEAASFTRQQEDVSRICRDVPLDNDAIPYEEGTDIVGHLIALIRHHLADAAEVVRVTRQQERETCERCSGAGTVTNHADGIAGVECPMCEGVGSLSSLQTAEWQAITRFEVISEDGRVYSRWPCSVTLDVQDQGRTLKVFVSPPPPDPRGQTP